MGDLTDVILQKLGMEKVKHLKGLPFFFLKLRDLFKGTFVLLTKKSIDTIYKWAVARRVKGKGI